MQQTFNDGIYSPELAHIQSNAAQVDFKETDNHFRVRMESIARQMPDRFELASETDLEAVRDPLLKGLEEVVQFYKQMTGARSIVDYYRRIPALYLSELGLHFLLQAGEVEEAKAYVSALRDKHGEEKRWTIFEGKYQSIFDEHGEALGAE